MMRIRVPMMRIRVPKHDANKGTDDANKGTDDEGAAGIAYIRIDGKTPAQVGT
jgi:hypothetical protein